MQKFDDKGIRGEEGSKMKKHVREPKRSRGSIPPRAEGGAANEPRVGNQASFIRKCPRIFLLSVAAELEEGIRDRTTDFAMGVWKNYTSP